MGAPLDLQLAVDESANETDAVSRADCGPERRLGRLCPQQRISTRRPGLCQWGRSGVEANRTLNLSP